MKKLYTVMIETEIVVAAETPEEAEEEAEEAHRDIDNYSYSRHAVEMTHLPGDWDLDSIPYGAREESDPDRTIKNWIDAGAAEKYTALKDKLSKKTEQQQQLVLQPICTCGEDDGTGPSLPHKTDCPKS